VFGIQLLSSTLFIEVTAVKGSCDIFNRLNILYPVANNGEHINITKYNVYTS